MADGLPNDRARPQRSPVFLVASLESNGTVVDVRLRNISDGGALIDGTCLPQAGSAVVFRREAIVAHGTIAWVHGRLAGIQFDHPLEALELLRRIPAPPRVTETSNRSFRRPGLRDHRLSPTERVWVERLLRNAAPDRLRD